MGNTIINAQNTDISSIYKVFGEVVSVFIFCDYKSALYKANFPSYLNAYFYPLC